MTNKQKGIICITLSAFSFALMNAFVHLAGDVPTIQKSFFRNLIAFIFAFAVIAFSKKDNSVGIGGKFNYKKADIPLLIIRSAAGTLGILGNFYALDHINIADASMLNKLSPFFTIIFSYIFLKEKPRLIQAVGVVVAFIGSLFIIKPTLDITEILPALSGFMGGMGAGIAYTAVRALGKRGVRGPLIVLFFSGFSCLVVSPYLIFNFHPMTIQQVVILLGAGLAASGGQFAITAAYSYAPASEISVFDYTNIIFAAILGFFMFNQVPDVYSVIGYIIICGIGIVMFFYGNKSPKKA
jgi:drug/metabolite transporter (DMT)-like permease